MVNDSMNQKLTVVAEGRGEAEKVVLLSAHGDPIMKLSSCDKMNEGTPLTPKGWINRTNLISFGSKGIDSFKLPLRTVC